jgi:beta-barrel assembly-enhancing protease
MWQPGRKMKWRRLAVAILLLPAALPSPAHAQTNFKFTKVDFELLRQANQLDDYFSNSGVVFEDAATTQYVESVGRSVLPPGDPPEPVTWKFRVLRDPLPNAFALPNGTIYIHTGLLSLMRNEAQLAGILGHEETHVLNRHPYLEYRSERKTTVAVNIFGMAGGVVGYGGYGAASDVIMAVTVAAPALLVASAYGYSRELEQEADMRGLAAMENAGYDPHEMAATFRLLEQSEGPDPSFSLYRDHPRLDARIQYLNEYLKKNPPAAGPTLMNTGLYSDSTETVCRHDIGLQIAALRPRHAVTIALHLVDRYPTSEDYFLLGESYRAMGGRPPRPLRRPARGRKKTGGQDAF